jgi:hypothetical protein
VYLVRALRIAVAQGNLKQHGMLPVFTGQEQSIVRSGTWCLDFAHRPELYITGQHNVSEAGPVIEVSSF